MSLPAPLKADAEEDTKRAGMRLISKRHVIVRERRVHASLRLVAE